MINNIGQKNKDLYAVLATRIIKSQENVIGVNIADAVAQSSGVIYKFSEGVTFTKDPENALKSLVESFNELFGKASFGVTIQAVQSSGISKESLPKFLR